MMSHGDGVFAYHALYRSYHGIRESSNQFETSRTYFTRFNTLTPLPSVGFCLPNNYTTHVVYFVRNDLEYVNMRKALLL